MRILILLFLAGFAAASVYDALDDAAELMYQDFMLGMEEAGSLKEALGLDEDDVFADEAEDDIKSELGQQLREALDRILEKMKESLDKGKAVGEKFQEKLEELKEKMKDLKIQMGDKAKELMEKIRERAKNFLKELMDKLKNKQERDIDDDDEVDMILRGFNVKEMFKKLRKFLLGKIDKEKLKEKVEEMFGKGNELADSIFNILNEKGDKWRTRLLDLVDRYLGKKEEKERRSMKDVWEKVKNYFKDLHIELKEKYMKFGEWVKNVIGKGLEKSKDKMENIKNIAQEFVEHAKGVSKDVAVEAKEFLRPYKEDLGDLWKQVKEAAQDVLNRKD